MAESAGLKNAGLDNERLEFGGLENDGLEFGRLEKRLLTTSDVFSYKNHFSFSFS